MQGVQPAAKKTPSSAEEPRSNSFVERDHCGRVSRFKKGRRSTPSMDSPNPITITPPTLLRIGFKPDKIPPNKVAAQPQPIIKTTENPDTKARACRKVFIRTGSVSGSFGSEFDGASVIS